ncbi:MAG: hypothetical protein V7L23_02730, partial [Nostoc sp.]|uniref:hypothetical protein n=1 Tax=Nostoc sp. TaxID=1180 RepID=UPI002FF285C9
NYIFLPSDFCLLPSALCLPPTKITKSCQEPIILPKLIGSISLPFRQYYPSTDKGSFKQI